MSLRITHHLPSDHPEQLWKQLLHWAQQYPVLMALDGRYQGQPADVHRRYKAVLAVGVHTAISCGADGAFEALQAFASSTQDWVFGGLSYELKNGLESLHSAPIGGVEFPDLYFFQPQKCFFLNETGVEAAYLPEVQWDWAADSQAIVQQSQPVCAPQHGLWHSRLSREAYLKVVQQLQAHIQRGDVYEVNFCTEFYTHIPNLNTLPLWLAMVDQAQAPFSAWFKKGAQELLCSSPERFIQLKGQHLISQPIKGTARRHADALTDQQSAQQLVNDPKERAENTMIIDLVRNDLSKVALPNSVALAEGWALHSFGRVHQLISTLQCTLRPEVGLAEVLRATFPMGSMTGAPKIRAMELIDAYEPIRRGWFSGSVGYIDPQGDLDFNVVIRSLLYDRDSQYLSCPVGGAITIQSQPEQEYEECMIKIGGIQALLTP